MRVISDGLGSGVTPEQLETSVELGRQWLEAIKQYDFSEQRQEAIDQKMLSDQLVDMVRDFTAPVEDFKGNVSVVEEQINELTDKLNDLKGHAHNTSNMVRKKMRIILFKIFL